jgi:hypothetical protein
MDRASTALLPPVESERDSGTQQRGKDAEGTHPPGR